MPKAIEYTEQETDAMSKWLAEPQNAAGETLYEVVKKLVFSYFAYGNAFCEITKSNTSISIYAHETRDLRPQKSNDRIVTTFGFCSIGIVAKWL